MTQVVLKNLAMAFVVEVLGIDANASAEPFPNGYRFNLVRFQTTFR